MQQIIEGKRTHAKVWADYVEDSALKQINDLCALPFIHKHIAVMPDVHAGYGSTVGSVIPTKGAIIPAAVGVDIGCGMMAVQLDLNAAQLPDSLKGARTAIEAAIPAGRTDHGGKSDRGAWGDELPAEVKAAWAGMAESTEIGNVASRSLFGMAITEKERMFRIIFFGAS